MREEECDHTSVAAYGSAGENWAITAVSFFRENTSLKFSEETWIAKADKLKTE